MIVKIARILQTCGTAPITYPISPGNAGMPWQTIVCMYKLHGGVIDIGITTAKSPALDIAALCLISWPAAIFAQVPNLRLLPAVTC